MMQTIKKNKKKREKGKSNELSNVIQRNSHLSTEESLTRVKELLSSRIWLHRDRLLGVCWFVEGDSCLH